MTAQRTCAECGAELTVDAPQGLCPKCLLQHGAGESAPGSPKSWDEQTVVDPKARSHQLSVASGQLAGERILLGAGPPTEHGSRIVLKYFGDYELLEEIARGGMGVVYKARQVSLNRIVAVKMILAGQLASEAEVKRFRTEAEAAANLQHPNIVAIHEIGEHQGQHYFSMDYVKGKSLSELVHARGGPVAPEKAAQLVKTIAEAIQYAHQRGILHRDLKPQNVLMDGREQPRITDFGLAKQIARDSNLTATGAVLGSPSYMAPEQAAGHQAQVGPASDVYALGAILYFLLTGRAPFVGATPLKTMLKVVEDDPPPPRKVRANVPVDLETICLKCLEKSPERRYATARALAEELGRFMSHDPILARPVSAWRKAENWVRRRPWALTGVAMLVIVLLSSLCYGLWEQSRYLRWLMDHPDHLRQPGLLAMSVEELNRWGVNFIAGFFIINGLVSYRRRTRSKRGTAGVLLLFRTGGSSALELWTTGLLGAAFLAFAGVVLIASIKAFVWEGAFSPLRSLFGYAWACWGAGMLCGAYLEHQWRVRGGLEDTGIGTLSIEDLLQVVRHELALQSVDILGALKLGQFYPVAWALTAGLWFVLPMAWGIPMVVIVLVMFCHGLVFAGATALRLRFGPNHPVAGRVVIYCGVLLVGLGILLLVWASGRIQALKVAPGGISVNEILIVTWFVGMLTGLKLMKKQTLQWYKEKIMP